MVDFDTIQADINCQMLECVDCNDYKSIMYQLDMLTDFLDIASANSSRFNLTIKDVDLRRRWVESTRHGIFIILNNKENSKKTVVV